MQNWTKEQDEHLKKIYSNKSNKELSKIFNRSKSALKNRAHLLGLKKDMDYIKMKTQFKNGHIPFNKGLKMTDYNSSASIQKIQQTQFKKGNIPHNTKSCNGIITIRKHKGIPYKYIRVELGKWQLLHRYNWEQQYGSIPYNHNIMFKDKNTLNCEIGNLNIISKQENARRNSIQNYTPEQQQTLRIISKINKKIKTHEKQTI